MRIYLLGFMGSGKSTMGQRVAGLLGVQFLDTDELVEKESGLDINQLFAQQGEHEFRRLETEMLRRTAEYEKALIATGGGLPLYHHNMDWLTEHGITMYLQWPDQMLISNVLKNISGRPLLSGLNEEEVQNKLKKLLQDRKPVYEQSAMTLEMAGDVEKDVKLLERACKYIW